MHAAKQSILWHDIFDHPNYLHLRKFTELRALLEVQDISTIEQAT